MIGIFGDLTEVNFLSYINKNFEDSKTKYDNTYLFLRDFQKHFEIGLLQLIKKDAST